MSQKVRKAVKSLLARNIECIRGILIQFAINSVWEQIKKMEVLEKIGLSLV